MTQVFTRHASSLFRARENCNLSHLQQLIIFQTMSDQETRTPSRSWIDRCDQLSLICLVILTIGSLVFYYHNASSRKSERIKITSDFPELASLSVNINSADWPELTQLPGIGEKLAKRIVMFREKWGSFQQHLELTQIDGIGRAKLKMMKPFLAPMDRIDGFGPSEKVASAY